MNLTILDLIVVIAICVAVVMAHEAYLNYKSKRIVGEYDADALPPMEMNGGLSMSASNGTGKHKASR